MAKYDFTLVLKGSPDLTEELADALYAAGCDDGTPGTCNGVFVVDFHRQAPSLEEAIRSAIAHICSAGHDAEGDPECGCCRTEGSGRALLSAVTRLRNIDVSITVMTFEPSRFSAHYGPPMTNTTSPRNCKRTGFHATSNRLNRNSQSKNGMMNTRKAGTPISLNITMRNHSLPPRNMARKRNTATARLLTDIARNFTSHHR